MSLTSPALANGFFTPSTTQEAYKILPDITKASSAKLCQLIYSHREMKRGGKRFKVLLLVPH